MTLLIQNQAAFMSAFISHLSRTEERFDKIERLLMEDRQILADLQNRLQDAVARLQDTMAHLPEAVQEKIGFKARR